MRIKWGHQKKEADGSKILIDKGRQHITAKAKTQAGTG